MQAEPLVNGVSGAPPTSGEDPLPSSGPPSRAAPARGAGAHLPLQSLGSSELEGSEGSEGSGDESLPPIVPGEPVVLVRRRTPEQVARELRRVRGMWQLAAVWDFFALFRGHLRLEREFGMEELEQALVCSAGDDGLLADVHVCILRGISPKSEIHAGNWVVHLANKIKFHWKSLVYGPACPFKPGKYYEALAYAALPAEARVRALHLICCIRVDREDVQARLERAAKEPSEAEEAAAAEKRARAEAAPPTRARAAAAKQPCEESADAFRKEPLGATADGARWFYVSAAEGFRLYRESEAAGGEDEDEDDGEGRDGAGVEAAQASKDASEDGHQGDVESNLEPESELKPELKLEPKPEPDPGSRAGSFTQPASERELNPGAEDPPPPAVVVVDGERLELLEPEQRQVRRKGRRLKSPRRVNRRFGPPPGAGRWEVAARTMEEVEAVIWELRRSAHEADAALGALLAEHVLPNLVERRRAEERRRRAAERTARHLGASGAEAVGSGEAGGGERTRRGQRRVNYAFDPFEEAMRGEEDGRRRGAKAAAGGPAQDPGAADALEAARRGLRRGRSAARRGDEALWDAAEREAEEEEKEEEEEEEEEEQPPPPTLPRGRGRPRGRRVGAEARDAAPPCQAAAPAPRDALPSWRRFARARSRPGPRPRAPARGSVPAAGWQRTFDSRTSQAFAPAGPRRSGAFAPPVPAPRLSHGAVGGAAFEHRRPAPRQGFASPAPQQAFGAPQMASGAAQMGFALPAAPTPADGYLASAARQELAARVAALPPAYRQILLAQQRQREEAWAREGGRGGEGWSG